LSKRIFAFFSLVVFAAVSYTALSLDAAAASEGKAVLIVADYLNIEDVNSMEFVGQTASGICRALMNNRQPGTANAAKSKLIIGSGKRLELGADMRNGGSDERSRSIHGVTSGKLPEQYGLVYTDIYRLIKRNEDSEYQNFIGYLGESVKKGNGVTCYIGNADTSRPDRSSMLIAADSSGEIGIGETENITIEDRLFPYGRRTDYNKLAELYKQYLPASSFIVVETGDLERLERYKYYMSEASYKSYRAMVIKDIDGFVEELVDYGGYNILIFISTYPSKADVEQGNRLTPVVVFGNQEEGLLYSNSTRRAGIILNTDLADYILVKLGLRNSCAISESPKAEGGVFLEDMNRRIVMASKLRLPVLTAFAAMIMSAVVVLFAYVVFLRSKLRESHGRLSAYVVYTILSFPLVLLYLPTAVPGESPAVYMMFAAAAALMLSLLLQLTARHSLRVVLALCILQLAALAIDIITGSPFIKQSVLGYDPIIGARFYGIGNEYAGIFIGCSLIIPGCLQELSGRRLSRGGFIAYALLCTALLGQSLYGANFGGAIAGAFGYILAFFLIYGIEFTKRNVIKGISVVCMPVILFFAAELSGITAASHMGRLIADTMSSGPGVVLATIQRKLAMNLRLIRYTIWTKVLICIIAAISLMLYKPVSLLREVFNRYAYMKYSWISVAAAAIIGFAVNDSGIVLAATAMIYVVFTMLLICIGERDGC
jgi:hypothetical protein